MQPLTSEIIASIFNVISPMAPEVELFDDAKHINFKLKTGTRITFFARFESSFSLLITNIETQEVLCPHGKVLMDYNFHEHTMSYNTENCDVHLDLPFGIVGRNISQIRNAGTTLTIQARVARFNFHNSTGNIGFREAQKCKGWVNPTNLTRSHMMLNEVKAADSSLGSTEHDDEVTVIEVGTSARLSPKGEGEKSDENQLKEFKIELDSGSTSSSSDSINGIPVQSSLCHPSQEVEAQPEIIQSAENNLPQDMKPKPRTPKTQLKASEAKIAGERSRMKKEIRSTKNNPPLEKVEPTIQGSSGLSVATKASTGSRKTKTGSYDESFKAFEEAVRHSSIFDNDFLEATIEISESATRIGTPSQTGTVHRRLGKPMWEPLETGFKLIVHPLDQEKVEEAMRNIKDNQQVLAIDPGLVQAMMRRVLELTQPSKSIQALHGIKNLADQLLRFSGIDSEDSPVEYRVDIPPQVLQNQIASVGRKRVESPKLIKSTRSELLGVRTVLEHAAPLLLQRALKPCTDKAQITEVVIAVLQDVYSCDRAFAAGVLSGHDVDAEWGTSQLHGLIVHLRRVLDEDEELDFIKGSIILALGGDLRNILDKTYLMAQHEMACIVKEVRGLVSDLKGSLEKGNSQKITYEQGLFHTIGDLVTIITDKVNEGVLPPQCATKAKQALDIVSHDRMKATQSAMSGPRIVANTTVFSETQGIKLAQETQVPAYNPLIQAPAKATPAVPPKKPSVSIPHIALKHFKRFVPDNVEAACIAYMDAAGASPRSTAVTLAMQVVDEERWKRYISK